MKNYILGSLLFCSVYSIEKTTLVATLSPVVIQQFQNLTFSYEPEAITYPEFSQEALSAFMIEQKEDTMLIHSVTLESSTIAYLKSSYREHLSGPRTVVKKKATLQPLHSLATTYEIRHHSETEELILLTTIIFILIQILLNLT